MTLPIAERWFEHQRIDAAITRLWEPHVVPLMRCNIWHVRGRDRDLVIDTGMGIASLVAAMQQLLDKPVTAVATHGHGDHIGGHHEFDDCIAHALEAPLLQNPRLASLEHRTAFGSDGIARLARAGYDMSEPSW
ncbi:MAG TPA: MBL fold metallo-hydrolase [Planctomycetota bacterium]|nr:MBL fold metallo-hydrolase [Planctomycetota bacterium]